MTHPPSLHLGGTIRKSLGSVDVIAFILLTLALCIPASAQQSSDSDPTLREYEGIVEPVERYVFTARFDGILQSVNFIPGQTVNKGDLVFEFSPTAMSSIGITATIAAKHN